MKEKFICHHCKYIGQEKFFYSCTQKSKNSPQNNRLEIFKEFFNLKNSSKICEKKYCLDCVKKYCGDLNNKIKRNWICPFCIVN